MVDSKVGRKVDSKATLKDKLAELKKQIKANAKDAHWMDNALRDYESLVGQLKHETVELEIGKKVDEWAGETFRLTKTTHGVLYHTYGGYSVFCTPNITSLYETLCDYIDNKEEYDKLEGEAKDNLELTLSALSYCISLPSFVCSDANFLFDTAGSIVAYLREISDKLLNTELKDETVEDVKANEAYKEAELGVRSLVSQIDEEVKAIKEKES